MPPSLPSRTRRKTEPIRNGRGSSAGTRASCRIGCRLFTFLVGQQEPAVKTALQQAHKTQIVARPMVEELAFFGIRNVRDVATCLVG